MYYDLWHLHAVPCVGLQYVIVVFLDHTHLLFIRILDVFLFFANIGLHGTWWWVLFNTNPSPRQVVMGFCITLK